MFGLFKSDPAKKLRKQYSAKLEAAMHAQRNGDIRGYATLTEEAEALWKQLEPLERDKPRGFTPKPSGQHHQMVGQFVALVGGWHMLLELCAAGLDAAEKALQGLALFHLLGKGRDYRLPGFVG